jgi:large subunit ribosomal protein L24
MLDLSTQKPSKYFPFFLSELIFIYFSTATRISYGYLEDGTKVRISKKTGSVIPKPARDDLKFINRTKDKKVNDYDTKPEDVLEKTYRGEDFVKIFNEFHEYIRMKEEKEEKLLVFRD